LAYLQFWQNTDYLNISLSADIWFSGKVSAKIVSDTQPQYIDRPLIDIEP
jgi:hypothetical protein